MNLLLSSAACTINGKLYALETGKRTFFEGGYTEANTSYNNGVYRFTLNIHPTEKLTINQMGLEFRASYPAGTTVFGNGFQSWTDAREYLRDEKIEPLRSMARKYVAYMGDDTFYKYPDREGVIHSWSYTYIRHSAQQILLAGSLTEYTGYTNFIHDTHANTLRVEKELAGLTIEHSFPVFDIVWMYGEQDWAWDEYFKALEIEPVKHTPLLGWNSWYQYRNKINSAIIKANLEGYAQMIADSPAVAEDKAIVFQVDDGWQKVTGEWLPNAGFPEGMRSLADAIHEKGMKAGLWLAPFVVAEGCYIYNEKPQWLLTDTKTNKPLAVGWNPYWKGKRFYALDIYKPEVRSYIMGMLDTVLRQWGYDMVKLDYLYVAGVLPRIDKTRGQVMTDAMDLLREATKGKWMLSCGVPLVTAFGKTDYCRIGPDVDTHWESGLLQFANHRERLSTPNALINAVYRYPLHNRAFANDTDVFVFRKDHHQLSREQQELLLQINTLLGTVAFTSDSVNEYSAADKQKVTEALARVGQSKIEHIAITHSGMVSITYTYAGQTHHLYANLTTGKLHHPTHRR